MLRILMAVEWNMSYHFLVAELISLSALDTAIQSQYIPVCFAVVYQIQIERILVVNSFC